jgi:hypothetical protein
MPIEASRWRAGQTIESQWTDGGTIIFVPTGSAVTAYLIGCNLSEAAYHFDLDALGSVAAVAATCASNGFPGEFAYVPGRPTTPPPRPPPRHDEDLIKTLIDNSSRLVGQLQGLLGPSVRNIPRPG